MKLKLLPSLAAGAAALSLVVAACSGGGGASPGSRPPPPGAGEDAAVVSPESLRQPPLVKGPVSPDGLQAILATTDLRVGGNRFGFLLTSPEGFVLIPTADVSFRYLGTDGGAGKLGGSLIAENHIWPFGPRGLYATEATFDRPGPWAVDIRLKGSRGEVKQVELAFKVAETPAVPGPGMPAPPSRTKTLSDVPSIANLTTGSLHEPDFYRVRLSEALASGRPTVFVLASPAFCTNATCGPILETVQMVKDEYRAAVNFVHADFFDNPGEIQDDLGNARISPVSKEWGVTDTEWTFVIDRRGVIQQKYEGYVTFEELKDALRHVM